MIVKGQALEQMLKRPATTLRAVLFYGPNAGRIQEYAGRAVRAIVEDISDPFRIAHLTAADLKEDPARLADEAAALTMTGGRRVVRVRGVGDAQTEAFVNCLEVAFGDSLIVAEAGELAKSSKLRKLFEASPACAIAACYEESDADMEALVIGHLRQYGLSVTSEARDYLLHCLGEDRLVTRQELDKLVLYKGPRSILPDRTDDGADPHDTGDGGDVYAMRDRWAAGASDIMQIELADVRACIGDSASQGLDSICDAMALGDPAGLDRQIQRAYDGSISTIAILRAASNHLLRAQMAMASLDTGASIDMALRNLRPPVHFSRAQLFRKQLGLWDSIRIARALDMLLEAEMACKTTGAPDHSLCRRALLQVAFMSRRNA